jgi:hypothetical protein
MAVTATERRGDSENGKGRMERSPVRAAWLWKRLRLSAWTFGLIVLLGLFHVYLSHRPLWHTDLWGHLAYGRLIAANHAIPSTEPFMPLARGVRFVDLSWLSQVVGDAAYQWEGIAAIQFLYATSIVFCLGLLAFGVARRTRLIWPALVAVVACTWLEWQQFLIVRPQLVGLACFVSLFVYLSQKRPGKERWVVVPLLFALWANLHGSFAVGLALLTALAAGRGIDVVLRTGRCRSVSRDRKFRTLTMLIPASALAVLVNPYGWTILRGVWETANNPNLADLVEWRPLDILMRQGQAAAAIALVLIVIYRLTPRRVSSTELLLLVGLGGATLRSSRMIVWWTPVASYYLAIHAAAIWNRFRESVRRPHFAAGRPSSLAWGLAALVAICATGAASPLGLALMHERRVNPEESLSPQTPLAAAAYLNAHPPRGQIFNAYEWGDYLIWGGPKGLRVFVASHAHLIPRDVWQDYLRVITLRSGWEKILDRYGVDLAVLDPDQQGDLVDAFRDSPDWSIAQEDDRSVIFVRRQRVGPMDG